MSKQTTGEFLSLLRKAAGYTQEDVAEKLNISNKTISSWETDRTMPDVLLLPAIADLYKVTVDEILRGERTQPDKAINNELTEKLLKASRKNKLGKFSARCNLLCSISCLVSVIVFLVLGFVILFTQPWVSLFLLFICFISIIICALITVYLANGVKLTEGIVLDEDLTPENKNLALTLNQKICEYFTKNALVFWLITFYSLIYFMIMSSFRELQWVLIIFAIPAIVCLILVMSGIIYRHAGIKKYGDEKSKRLYGINAKISVKIACFASIPVLIAIILAIVFASPIHHVNGQQIYKADNFEDFKNNLQTLTVTEADGIHSENGAPVGEYILNFPQSPEESVIYDLGNGFYGKCNFDFGFGGKLNLRSDVWEIAYGDNNEICGWYTVYKFNTPNGIEKVVNLRYTDNVYMAFSDFGITKYTTYEASYIDGEYAFNNVTTLKMQLFGVLLTCITFYVFTSLGIVIYFVRRKK